MESQKTYQEKIEEGIEAALEASSDIQAENYRTSLLFYNSNLIKKWKYLDFDLTLNSEIQDNFDDTGNLQDIHFLLLNFQVK